MWAWEEYMDWNTDLIVLVKGIHISVYHNFKNILRFSLYFWSVNWETEAVKSDFPFRKEALVGCFLNGLTSNSYCRQWTVTGKIFLYLVVFAICNICRSEGCSRELVWIFLLPVLHTVAKHWEFIVFRNSESYSVYGIVLFLVFWGFFDKVSKSISFNC